MQRHLPLAQGQGNAHMYTVDNSATQNVHVLQWLVLHFLLGTDDLCVMTRAVDSLSCFSCVSLGFSYVHHHSLASMSGCQVVACQVLLTTGACPSSIAGPWRVVRPLRQQLPHSGGHPVCDRDGPARRGQERRHAALCAPLQPGECRQNSSTPREQ